MRYARASGDDAAIASAEKLLRIAKEGVNVAKAKKDLDGARASGDDAAIANAEKVLRQVELSHSRAPNHTSETKLGFAPSDLRSLNRLRVPTRFRSIQSNSLLASACSLSATAFSAFAIAASSPEARARLSMQMLSGNRSKSTRTSTVTHKQ
eukprot:2241421-Rhodomonas_salina.2